MLVTKRATGSKYFDINDNMNIIIISSTLIEESERPKSGSRKSVGNCTPGKRTAPRVARLAQSIEFGWWL